MKALLNVSVFSLALAITACNNSGENKSTTDSTTTTTVDTPMTTTDTSHSSMKMAPDTATVPMVEKAEAIISGTYPDTTVTGTAKFTTGKNSKVKMVLDITAAAKAGKSVAVHLHEHGDCGDSGKMAHGHWNPTNAQHGKWGQGSFHSGDIGNVKLDSKGKGTVTIETDLWTLGGKWDKNVLGKAVIVHGGVDDFTTQPTGNAGSRIGCGVIK
ncbi:superoxide dismutase family protein [Terrimonas alba]|uniref:superoxide dismutase family protein n=1 Tax=Terrimonas alba TaxID=3349636 RepID=UPI0035F3BE50